MATTPTQRRYVPQPDGSAHLYYKLPRRKRWVVQGCEVCGRPLEHYLQADGSYMVKHRHDQVLTSPKRPPTSVFICDDVAGDTRLDGEKIEEGFRVLGEAEEG